jgi:hypothetical protein
MTTDRELFRSVVLNFVMGSCFGRTIYHSLLVMNVQNISQVLQHSTSPAEERRKSI